MLKLDLGYATMIMLIEFCEIWFVVEFDDIVVVGLIRRWCVLVLFCGCFAVVDGCELFNFASNDYFGLVGNRDIVQVVVDGALVWGVGSGVLHLVSNFLNFGRS